MRKSQDTQTQPGGWYRQKLVERIVQSLIEQSEGTTSTAVPNGQSSTRSRCSTEKNANRGDER